MLSSTATFLRWFMLLLEAGVKSMDLATNSRLFAGRSILRHTRKGIAGMSLILDRIPTARQRELAGRDFLSGRCGELCHRWIFPAIGAIKSDRPFRGWFAATVVIYVGRGDRNSGGLGWGHLLSMHPFALTRNGVLSPYKNLLVLRRLVPYRLRKCHA